MRRVGAKVASAWASPVVPVSGAGRAGSRAPSGEQPRHRACQSGCLSNASSGTGAGRQALLPPPAARTRRPACRRARAAESSAGTFQRASAPARGGRAAIGRHQRGGLAFDLHRLAQRYGDGERFFFGIGGFDRGDAAAHGGRFARDLRASACRQRSVCGGRHVIPITSISRNATAMASASSSALAASMTATLFIAASACAEMRDPADGPSNGRC